MLKTIISALLGIFLFISCSGKSERKNFEIGLTAVLKLDLNFTKDINPLIARDKALESSAFITIPLNKKSIKKFIQENEMIPHGKYTLERVLLRENISLS